MSRPPGFAVPAEIRRAISGQQRPIKILDLTLRRLGGPKGLLFQADTPLFQFNEQGASLTQQNYCLSDWPDGVTDPLPIHPNDTLFIPFAAPVTAAVRATPKPTQAQVAIAPGASAAFAAGYPMQLGAQSVMLVAKVVGPGYDTLYVGNVNAVPQAGDVITQTGWTYRVARVNHEQYRSIRIYVELEATA